MTRLLLCLVPALALVFAPVHAPAQAKDSAPHKALEAAHEVLPWQAVGRLDMARGGYCTGALISKRLVLTAAHCVYDRRSGELRQASDLVFRAGYRRGRAAATRKAKRFVVHRDYKYGGGSNTYTNIAVDVAVIELEREINDAAVQPFPTHREPQAKDRVMVVSYGRGRSETPALEEGCQMTHAAADVLHYTCDIDFGSSGAPVFVMTNQGPRIASIMSSGHKRGGKETALGAPLGPAVDAMVRQLQTSNPTSRFLKVGGGERRTGVITSRLPQIGN